MPTYPKTLTDHLDTITPYVPRHDGVLEECLLASMITRDGYTRYLAKAILRKMVKAGVITRVEANGGVFYSRDHNYQ